MELEYVMDEGEYDFYSLELRQGRTEINGEPVDIQIDHEDRRCVVACNGLVPNERLHRFARALLCAGGIIERHRRQAPLVGTVGVYAFGLLLVP